MVTGTTVKGIVSNTALTQELERTFGLMLKDRGLTGKALNGNEITMVIQSGGQKRDCLGHFAESAWSGIDLESREYTDQRIHEIAIMAEHLNRDIYQIMATLRHESVHYENFICGNQDCSKGGAHNAKYFKAVAEECGLIVTHGKEHGKPGKAWAFTEPSEEFKVWIDTVIKPNVELFNMARLQNAPAEKKQSTMQSLKCGCTVDEEGNKIGSTVSMSRGEVQRRIAKGTLPLDEECGQRFLPQD